MCAITAQTLLLLTFNSVLNYNIRRNTGVDGLSVQKHAFSVKRVNQRLLWALMRHVHRKPALTAEPTYINLKRTRKRTHKLCTQPQAAFSVRGQIAAAIPLGARRKPRRIFVA